MPPCPRCRPAAQCGCALAPALRAHPGDLLRCLDQAAVLRPLNRGSGHHCGPTTGDSVRLVMPLRRQPSNLQLAYSELVLANLPAATRQPLAGRTFRSRHTPGGGLPRTRGGKPFTSTTWTWPCGVAPHARGVGRGRSAPGAPRRRLPRTRGVGSDRARVVGHSGGQRRRG